VAKLILYQNADAVVALDGATAGPQWVATALLIERGGAATSYPLTPQPQIPTTALAPLGGDWRLSPQPGIALFVSGAFRDESDGPLDVLGRKFSNTAGYRAELELTIVGHDAAHFDTGLTLHVCGHIELTVHGGVSVFASAAVCFDLAFSQLSVLPSTTLPQLRLRMPDVAFEWPDFDWPWPPGSSGLPSLPSLPWSMGWPALEFPSLFLKLSWQRVALFEKDPANNDHTLVLEIIGLRVEGPTGRMIDATLHLEWDNAEITTGSYIELPGQPSTKLQVKHWYRSDECVAVAWTGKQQLEQWLTLILPEALVPDLENDAEIAVRVAA
jgi:hypothetical protein